MCGRNPIRAGKQWSAGVFMKRYPLFRQLKYLFPHLLRATIDEADPFLWSLVCGVFPWPWVNEWPFCRERDSLLSLISDLSASNVSLFLSQLIGHSPYSHSLGCQELSVAQWANVNVPNGTQNKQRYFILFYCIYFNIFLFCFWSLIINCWTHLCFFC